MPNPGDLVPYGDDAIVRRQDDAARRQRERESARSLAASQIGSGGLLINNGGSLTISGTGSLNVGSGALNSAGSISAGTTITAGGTITGGAISTGGNVSASGQVSGSSLAVSGGATVGGNATVSGQIFVPNSFAAVSGYTVAYINSDGRLSNGASAARYKQDFEPVSNAPLVEAILRAPLLRFRLIAAVEEFGDEAALEIGLLADYLLKIGLGEFVYTDAEGEPRGINYERLTIPLIATVQALDARLKDITSRLDAAGL